MSSHLILLRFPFLSPSSILKFSIEISHLEMPFPFLFTFSQSGINHDRISLGAGIGLPSISTYSPDGSTFTQWLTQWRYNDRENTIRKIICVTGILLHIPLNLFYIRAWGSLWILWGILSALFNFWFVCIGFWWLDIMRGERWVYGRRYVFIYLTCVCRFDYAVAKLMNLQSERQDNISI